MKKLSLLAASAALVLSASANAAHWCEAFIERVVPNSMGITVYSTSAYDGRTLDVMYKDYDDSNFGGIYMRALDAQKYRYKVRLYPVEAKGEEDGARCDDGVKDYLRTIYRP
ncbi:MULTISPECIES: hypothetical protein [unclassified Pseudoalteromonas]|uniref:hypothetical protein n=1 Tax=unclassified Pseudoalteromonas TaxID=194690 RepID=UPI0006B53D45|nr:MULTISPECIES: hypothetical protein [unclassified Pseudoalteromonas]AZZ96099.1 hypothetical protein ELR70_02540 [Pseudoalteromonas sp. R3]MCO7187511.1 hypothetical protein [Pseudoalteromonas sp. XMcav2-N]